MSTLDQWEVQAKEGMVGFPQTSSNRLITLISIIKKQNEALEFYATELDGLPIGFSITAKKTLNEIKEMLK